MSASAKIFLSTVSDEFRAYRDQLRSDLTRPNVEVRVQEDFKDQGRGTLDALDVYIAGCDAVVHVDGDMTGSAPGEPALSALRALDPAALAACRRLLERAKDARQRLRQVLGGEPGSERPAAGAVQPDRG